MTGGHQRAVVAGWHGDLRDPEGGEGTRVVQSLIFVGLQGDSDMGASEGQISPHTPLLSIPNIQVPLPTPKEGGYGWGRLKCKCSSALDVARVGGDGGKFTPEISQMPCTETLLRNELEKGGAPESWEAGTWRHSERPLGSWVGMGGVGKWNRRGPLGAGGLGPENTWRGLLGAGTWGQDPSD